MPEANTSWKARRTGDGWEGTIRINVGGLPLSIGAEGTTPREALARAAIAMKTIAASPAARAVLPPGTAAAIAAIHHLSTAPNVRAALANYGGRGARRLARALGF